MTDIFGQYQSQSTRALASIDSSKYADTNKDMEANVRRLNDFVDYMAQYMGVMQKGIDKSKQDVIGQVRSFAADFLVLLGGGSLASFNFGDLQYFLPALGALFGFDSNIPFPLNLFQAAEHFFLGYIVPLDSWPTAIEGIIGGFMTSLGLNPAFIAAVYLILNNMGRFTNALMTIFNDLTSLLGVFNIFDFVGGPIGTIWHTLTTLLGNFNITNLGTIADPFLATLTPWLNAYGVIIGIVDDFLETFTIGLNSSGFGGFSNITNWLGDLLSIFGLSNLSALGSGNVNIPIISSIPILGPFFNMYLNFAKSIFGGAFSGDPISGFFSIFTDALGLLGNPAGMGTGNPILGALSTIPLLAPATTFIQDLIDALLTAIRGIPVVGGVIADVLTQVTGLTNTSNTAASTATTALGNVGGLITNLITTPATVIGNLLYNVVDAAAGTIEQLLNGLFAGSQPLNRPAGAAGGTGSGIGGSGAGAPGAPQVYANGLETYSSMQQQSYQNYQMQATSDQQNNGLMYANAGVPGAPWNGR